MDLSKNNSTDWLVAFSTYMPIAQNMYSGWEPGGFSLTRHLL